MTENPHLYARTIDGLHNFLVDHLPEIDRNLPILDLGCGTGAWLNQLHELGFSKLYGTDLDVRQLATDIATVQACDLDYEEIPFPDLTFGFITCLEV
ncbi:MAG: class I SAM-dependent methyltransferase, partial [Verrucomicrobiota bacterium]